jgi:branched-chain amino acid aminotransferase
VTTTSTPSAADPRASGPALVWVDGRVLHGRDATVAALDHGVVVGDGVFEAARVTPAGSFADRLHRARLERSCAGLALEPPPRDVQDAGREELLTAWAALAEASYPAVLRTTWTAGRGPLGSGRLEGPGTLLLAVAPAPPRTPSTAAVTVPWVRNERSAVAGLKTTSYAENVVALRRAQQAGASEALMANTRGELCEGTGSNVLVRVGDELLTPPLASGCLAGITRLLLLRWAAEEGLPVREAALPMSALAEAEEVLLTSSLRDVQHVTQLDGRALGSSDLGAAAVELFARRAAAEPDPLP